MHLATARLPSGLGKVRGPFPAAVAVCPRAGVVWQSEPRRTTSTYVLTMMNDANSPDSGAPRSPSGQSWWALRASRMRATVRHGRGQLADRRRR